MFPSDFCDIFQSFFLLLPILKPLDPQKQLCKFIPELVTI